MKGVYLVFFRLESDRNIEVGALGELRFEQGLYVYVGSAQNSLENRIGRHFSSPDSLFWHIDYFSEQAEPVDYFVLPEVSDYECLMTGLMAEIGEPVKAFGCSDCTCESHLFRVPSAF